MKTKLSVKHFYELEWYHVYLGSSKSSLMLYLLYNNHNKSHVKNVFFFFFYTYWSRKESENLFYYYFFFHLDPHFYFSKMEKMKRKIWREGESIIVHLITFFLFLLHFIFLSTIKKKKKYTLSTYNYLWIYHYLRGWLTVYAAQALA